MKKEPTKHLITLRLNENQVGFYPGPSGEQVMEIEVLDKDVNLVPTMEAMRDRLQQEEISPESIERVCEKTYEIIKGELEIEMIRSLIIK